LVDEIHALLALKAGWPVDNFGDDKWVMSGDSVHFVTCEPSHEKLPKDSACFSHNHHAAGFNQEIGLSLSKSMLARFDGPFKAVTFNDIKMLVNGGLKAKPQCTKKMVIADHGCTGYPALVSMSNSQDSEEASTFKVQAQQRHKKDNDKLKTFWCLDDRFSSDTNAAVAIFDF